MNNNKIHIAFNDLKRIVSSHFIEAYISIDSKLKRIMFYHKKMAKQKKILFSFNDYLFSTNEENITKIIRKNI